MLIEGIQQDKDTFQSFRERNVESVSSSVYSSILSQYSSVVLILSTIYNSQDHIMEINELLPDYIQSFKKISFTKELLMAMINIGTCIAILSIFRPFQNYEKDASSI